MDFSTYQKLIEQHKTRQDDNVIARFYDKTIKTSEVDNNGIPKFKTVCYCEIRIKDNTTEIYDQPATQDKIERFPVEYARYSLAKKKTENGTPLEQFAFLTASEIETCKYRGIFSIEDLANMSEEHAKDLNLNAEVNLAKQFITNSKRIKNAIDFSEIEADYKSQIADLKERIIKLTQLKRKHR